MPSFIYALCEPGTRTVRYIGKSSHLRKRLNTHLTESTRRDTPLGVWLRSLLSAGQRPALVVLREVPDAMWKSAEKKYIRIAKCLGMPLVNSTEGFSNMSPEVRAKIRAASLGRRHTPETKLKLSKPRGPLAVEHRANISKAMISKAITHGPQTAEHRAKISASLKKTL